MVPASFRRADLAIAGALVAIVAMMIVPMPSMLLDVLLTFNVAAALVIMLVSIFMTDPLQFNAFPPLLLITTLFRLALNVSSTRLLLLTGEAGQVIRQFGDFVVGGNTAVGLIIFLILIVVNFVVITKGSERVSEVSARFTLDALPGKQMAIDADLNAGLITEAAARDRRMAVAKEADFYGAMDGASKFVKGDAIAGLIITVVNLVGGLVVGMMQQDFSLGEAWAHFSLRTIGDGLISQIPALLISTATGIVVTRAAGETGLGTQLGVQLMQEPTAFLVAGIVVSGLGLVPGLPLIPFLAVGLALSAVGYMRTQQATKEAAVAAQQAAAAAAAEAQPAVPPEKRVTLAPVDPLEVELGYGLVSLADASRGGDLLDRVIAVRQQVAHSLGLLVPYIRVRDNIGLTPNEYVIKLRGVEVGRFELQPDRLLAMASGESDEPMPGTLTVEPAFGMEAVWISQSDRAKAEVRGYTVVDPAAIVIAHLTEVIKAHAADLLGRQEVRTMVETVRESHPALVEELTPVTLSLGEIQKVLQNLLREGVPIRDLVLIFEGLADWGGVTKDADQLTEKVRMTLGRSIAQAYGFTSSIYALTLAPELEQLLVTAVHNPSGEVSLDPAMAQKLMRELREQGDSMALRGYPPTLVCAPPLRPILRRVAEHAHNRFIVLSYAEIDPRLPIEPVGVIRL